MESPEPIFGGYTASALRDCARRELTQRRRVYRRLVSEGKMEQADATHEIAMMQVIADYFDSIKNPRLF
jgi:hypothetical protein